MTAQEEDLARRAEVVRNQLVHTIDELRAREVERATEAKALVAVTLGAVAAIAAGAVAGGVWFAIWTRRRTFAHRARHALRLVRRRAGIVGGWIRHSTA